MLGLRRVSWVALPAAAVGALVLAGAGGAAPSATLTVQLVPGAVSAGEPALAVATFHNLAAVTLPRARVTLHFPKGLSVVSAPGCGKVTPSTVNVVCGVRRRSERRVPPGLRQREALGRISGRTRRSR